MKSIRATFFRAVIFASLLALLASSAYAATIITIVDGTGIVGQYNSLVLNSSGFPVISYYDSGNNDLKVAVCGNATCSAGNTLTTVDSTGFVGLYTSLVLNSNGFPVISYYDITNNDLKVAVCGNATCSAGNTLTTVDSTGFVGLYTSLVLNNNGFPVISYYDIGNDDLKVAVCGNATCSAGNTLTTVDSTGIVGLYTSLVLNSNGFPVISYWDTNNGLKVAVCGNATCSAGNTLTIVDSVGSGRYTSLALNTSGFPVISYMGTNNDLKLAVCGNATCSAGNILTIVDSTGIVLNNSLVLNSSGFPVISYYDVTNNDLKIGLFDFATFDIAPTVVSQSLIASYTTGPSGFTVTFSENLFDPSGNTDVNDVTNPANYLLVEDGANNTFNTTACGPIPGAGGLKSDDTQITINNVSYKSETFTSTVNINGGIVLPDGKYKLFVCGTTSVADLALNKLNNGIADYTFEFVVGAATNALSLPKTGFAQNKITALPVQPVQLAYVNLDSLWLEIPSLKIKTNIVGIPKTDQGWDVNWLGQDAGWLNSTAFPSWEGNSVITAHVTNANGLPGPFANLKNLKYGDRIIIHIYDQQYIFEVQSSRMVRPMNTKSAIEHLEGHSYLTLITCQGYNPLSDSYLLRRVVRAVLVEVK